MAFRLQTGRRKDYIAGNEAGATRGRENVRATLPPFSAGGENIAMRGVFGAPYSGRAFTLPGAAGGTVSAVVADASGDAADWLLSASMAFTT